MYLSNVRIWVNISFQLSGSYNLADSCSCTCRKLRPEDCQGQARELLEWALGHGWHISSLPIPTAIALSLSIKQSGDTREGKVGRSNDSWKAVFLEELPYISSQQVFGIVEIGSLSNDTVAWLLLYNKAVTSLYTDPGNFILVLEAILEI